MHSSLFKHSFGSYKESCIKIDEKWKLSFFEIPLEVSLLDAAISEKDLTTGSFILFLLYVSGVDIHI